MTQTFKLVLLGDSGVGKTSFINRFATGDWDPKYFPTLSKRVVGLGTKFQTGKGLVEFEVHDAAGQHKFQGQCDGFYDGADCAIIMCSIDSKLSCKSVKAWYDELQKHCPGIPVVIAGSKYDTPHPVPVDVIDFVRKHNLRYYFVSARSCYNFDKPFVDLAGQLTGGSATFE